MYEGKLNNDKAKNRHCLSLFKNKGFVFLASVLIIVLTLGIVSLETKTNAVTYVTERVLKEFGIYNTEIKSVVIESSDYSSNTPGSWHINESAKWTGFGKAQVTLDVKSFIKRESNAKDIIIVLDVSDSMTGEKLEKVKSSSKELITYLLSDTKNRVALISFGSTSNVVSRFSNDKDLLFEKLSNLSVAGATNYNAAILNINQVMKGYVKEEDKDVVTLFITDGCPNVDTPNQNGTYEILKDNYPFMIVNGIQYEMGNTIAEEINAITNNQWSANKSNLTNVLFEAAVSPIVYEEFIITDYINNDYFTVGSLSDIKVSTGSATLSVEDGVQKITWNLGNNSYTTGANAKMTINLTLKDGYKENFGYYPTNVKGIVTSKLPEEISKTVSSTKTPVLKNLYQVIYDTNAPDGCTLEEVASENHFVFSNVTKKTDKLNCDGYLFKGWQIDKNDDRDIKKINDGVFMMPEHDVTIRATWTRQSVVKQMDGTVHEKTTLYKLFQAEAEKGTYAREYTGLHQDSIDSSGTEKIYYWYAPGGTAGDKISKEILNRNNVIFAGQCWQMMRTTDTGGVKLIYNGEAEDGKCLNTRGTHIGYNDRISQNLSGDFYYGTSYSYDKTTKTFTLAGDLTQETWSLSTYPNLVGKYTCESTTENGSCSTLYLVESYNNSTSGYVIPFNFNSHYSQIGKLQFNTNIYSPAYVGYMYNTGYDTHEKEIKTTGRLEIATEPVELSEYNVISNDTNYLYTFDESTKQWSSVNHEHSSTSKIEFSPVTPGDYYISYIKGSEYWDQAKFYVDGELKKTVYGSDTYTINLGALTTSSVIKVEYSKNVNSSIEPDQVKFSLARATGEVTDNRWKFGKNVEYKDGKYTLIDAIPLDLDQDISQLDTYHYTCLDSSDSCQKVSYVHYSNGSKIYYIQLENDTNIEKAINKMLHADDVNKTNSVIKSGIDAWYERYLINYTDYLEDTVFCNDRSISSLGGWDPNGGTISGRLLFGKSEGLSCKNETDRFSTLNEKAKLKYPVGLMHTSELAILSNAKIRDAGQYYWTGSPSYFSDSAYSLRGSYLNEYKVYGGFSVRPSISLKPDTGYSSGDGSMDYPYVVDLEK